MRRFRIRTQMLVPALVSLSVAGVIGFMAISRAFDRLAESQRATVAEINQISLGAVTNSKVKEVYNSIEQMSRKALEEVALFSRKPEVQEAYALALSPGSWIGRLS